MNVDDDDDDDDLAKPLLMDGSLRDVRERESVCVSKRQKI